jgi:hypothetical protein
MRRLAVAGILLVSCTLVATAQENSSPTETPGAGGNWFTRLFSSGAKPEVKKADEKKKTEPAVSAVEAAAAARVREDIILNRRNQACWKLREIAVRTGDSALLRKADELEERANELFFQRMADLTARAQALPSKGSQVDVAGSKQGQTTENTEDSTRGDER